MHRYRYRTRALIGPWRMSRAQAMADAVAAKQVLIDDSDPTKIRWLVPGDIEEEAEEEPRRGAAGRA